MRDANAMLQWLGLGLLVGGHDDLHAEDFADPECRAIAAAMLRKDRAASVAAMNAAMRTRTTFRADASLRSQIVERIKENGRRRQAVAEAQELLDTLKAGLSPRGGLTTLADLLGVKR